MSTNDLSVILDTDSYKASHYLQYPPGTDYMTSYLESRGGEYPSTLFFGLQYILMNQLAGIRVTDYEIEEAEEVFNLHGVPFNKEGWEHIADKHKGRLPIHIAAVPEGTVVPNGNVLMRVDSMDPKCFWLTSYVETILMRVWYPITVATRSHYLKRLILRYLNDTADNPEEEIAFKLHDFGSRGVSSSESAGIGGMSHLVSFQGTDTVAALLYAHDYYQKRMAGYSIPAAEHSTITSWGKENEADAYRNMLKQYAKPGSLVAVVSDSYNIYKAVEDIWGNRLRQEVIDSGATIVIRPDSGEPVEVVSKVVDILAEKFGFTVNTKGYKVLKNVRIIQGDGVNPQSIEAILEALKKKDYSASNIAFGMGGALLQKVDRDTQNMAYKCSGIRVNEEFRNVCKESSGKPSKAGWLELILTPEGEFKTINYLDVENRPKDGTRMLQTVFMNGSIKKYHTFDEIRARADSYLN